MITTLSSTKPAPSLTRLASLVAGVLAFAMVSVANAQQSFKTADAAADALVNAARAGDRNPLLTVLGRDGADIVSSGDPVADASARNRVVEAYDAKHQVVMEGNDKAVLVIGREDWPFPIPLVRKDGSWRFDTAAGREEILYRRIGRNELDAIETCLAMSTRSRNMPSGALPAMESTRNASSAGRVRRTVFIGQRNPARTRARSASSPPAPPRRLSRRPAAHPLSWLLL